MGRNELCHCGSTRKYKNCCMKIEKDIPKEREIIDEIRAIYKDSKIKECFHPQKEMCGNKIIKAHAIQNNKVLIKLSEKGQVIMTHYRPDKLFEYAHLYGRKQATTFSGFCNYHDQEVFKEIEVKKFSGETKQLFLYTYRAFVAEYYKKISDKNFSGNFSNKSNIISQLKKGQDMAIYDFSRKKLEFNKAIKSEKYDCLINTVWEFNFEINFAGSGYQAPIFDLEGNELQNLLKEDLMGHIYYNVFPEEGKSFAIISWLKSDNFKLRNLKLQLDSLTEIQRQNYISNLLINNTDNLVINPKSWNKLPEFQKEFFGMYESISLFESEGGFFSMIDDASVNLFKI
ncbi:YecA family protein [Staphylococcus agnetis]|uniref:YecA family protein n=1 Tax=Staphylococcus agnetis TaxID=985762 RepID=UPI00131A4268|nr:SEC-C domain-containing protein [Staphylococcus agnetis]